MLTASGGEAQPGSPGGGKRLAKLGGRFACLQVDDEAFAAVDRKRQLALREAEGLAGCSDGCAELGCIFDHGILTDREESTGVSPFQTHFLPNGKIDGYLVLSGFLSYRLGSPGGGIRCSFG